jgi:putative transposase
MSEDLYGPESALNGGRTIALRRPLPQLLKTDNGYEFSGKIVGKCVNERGIRIDFSWPGTPTDNATVESFNGRL